jgi:hypothetical protein
MQIKGRAVNGPPNSFYFFSNLSGLNIAQFLSEHLSGIVLVTNNLFAVARIFS